MRVLAVIAFGALAAAQQQPSPREIALGEHMARDVRKRTTPGGAEPYVRSLGVKLKAPGTIWQFDVVKEEFDSPTYDAIVFPGAYVFVPEKLILMAGSEAELAGMLAHAMARVTTHPQGSPWIYPPDKESLLRADRLAVQTVAAAGYDPAALLDYVKRLWPERPATSRMPTLAERVAAFQEALTNVPPRTEWRETSAAFIDAQEEIRRTLGHRRPKAPTLFRQP